MTLNPHAPKFQPQNLSRIFPIYRPELLIAMETSTSQDETDPNVPAKIPKNPIFLHDKFRSLKSGSTDTILWKLPSSRVWILPREPTPQICSPYSLAIAMMYWSGRSLRRFTFRFAVKSTPIVNGPLPSHP